jgi:hypothetical protein
MDRLCRQGESIEELCKDFPYVCVKRTLKGIMCLEYYLNHQVKYEEDIKGIPQTVYNTYIRAREADKDSKDVTLFLLRKTLEMLLKDISVSGGNLQTKINNVNEKLKVIESGMHKVREAGNKAVHEHDISFTDNEIQGMAENVETIMKLFYTL